MDTIRPPSPEPPAPPAEPPAEPQPANPRLPPKSGAAFRLATPLEFNGNRKDFAAFLLQVEVFLTLCRGTLDDEEQQIMVIVTRLKGEAFRWITPYLREEKKKRGSIEILHSTNAFLRELEATFGETDQRGKAERDIWKLKQVGSAHAYTSAFRSIIGHLQWDDTALESQYHMNLKERVKDEIARVGRPYELCWTVELAIRIDENLYNRELEQKEDQIKVGPNQLSHRSPNVPAHLPIEDPGDPMDLSATTMEEAIIRQHRWEKNLCFRYGSDQHRIRDCTDKGKEKTSSTNKGGKPKVGNTLAATTQEMAPVYLYDDESENE